MEDYSIITKILPLVENFSDDREIKELLMLNSNLPGPRGNLTLAFKFAEYFEKESLSPKLFDMLINWANLSYESAPSNAPEEYLTFCGILTLGAHYYFCNDTERKKLIMKQLRKSMSDRRWRAREGVAMGLQKIGERDFQTIRDYFSLFYTDSNLLEKRAFIATLAHPPILKDEAAARYSLNISDDIMESIINESKESRRTEEFGILSKGLQYALSVFTAALPTEGFELLKKYARVHDKDIRKIIKANLSKARLTKKYGAKVNEVMSILDE